MRINGRSCKVLPSSRAAATDLPLSVSNCERLANYYLGFNGWNSEVLCQRRVAGQLLTVVRLTFPRAGVAGEEVSVEGAGAVDLLAASDAGNLEGSEMCRFWSQCRKQSRSSAVQAAFSKVVLVVVNGGDKVCVDVDLRQKDPFHYESTWESYDAANVDEINYEIVEEDQ